MGIAERRSSVRRPSPATPSADALLVIIACALLLLYILIGTIVHRSLPDQLRAQTEDVVISHGD